MKVLIINTSDKIGGAAVASHRLMEALCQDGIQAGMLVMHKTTDDPRITDIKGKWIKKWKFISERIRIYRHLNGSREHLFEIDTAQEGFDITHTTAFKEADIIHLAWINQGMISLKGLKKIIRSGKPIAWTMHDMWPATSICHYTDHCEAYRDRCADCHLLPHGGDKEDLAFKIWIKKKNIFKDCNIHFITCSKWLKNQAMASNLIGTKDITDIPNPINTDHFKPTDKSQARKALGLPQDKKLILFVSQRVTDPRKGMKYFIKAIHKLSETHSDLCGNLGVILLGGGAQQIAQLLPIQTFPIGFITDEEKIIQVYNASDTYVLPSMQDNLPNTIIEAMACGVPCVGFDVGGIPEEIDHLLNGYVAKAGDAGDLARGMRKVLFEADPAMLGRAAVQKVHKYYSQKVVARRYKELYHRLMQK